MSQQNIQRISTIANLYEFANLDRAPIWEDFDLLFFSEFSAQSKAMLPPHYRNLCTIIFLEKQSTGWVNISDKRYHNLENVILFQGPEHIFSFLRDPQIQGSILLFSLDFLLPFTKELNIQYPFFSLTQQNIFHLNQVEQKDFKQLITQINHEKKQRTVLRHLLLAFLEKSLLLYQTYAKEEQHLSKNALLVRRFRLLINNFFLQQKQVDFYAKQLNLSAGHLNEVIKTQTGKTAKRHILDRVLLEAKNLLLYTKLDIAEIAFTLNYSETTHFNRFFKKETQRTPRHYRLQNL